MQQHQGGGPGQQFGLHPPEMPSFSPSGSSGQQRISMAEAPSPISSRPPAPGQQQLSNELPGAGAVGFDDEALAAGDVGLGGGAGGNRWPRQETLALLKIRSDMDAAFRDATLKGPLWEEVSRKLGDEGYRRSGKKCKEKFENVHKYYKRTKDTRAGRNDGKTYRFFQQLEALHGTPSVPPPATAVGVPGVVRPLAEPPPVAGGATAGLPTPVVAGNLSFSTSNTEEFSDEDDSDDEGTDDMADERAKRKRTSSEGGEAAGSGSGKMMRFFEGLMKQVMERQEAMQQRFLEAIEKREQDRMIREEAWRRQEMARLAREQEILAQERAMAATRDSAVLSFIQKITGQTVPMPSIAAPAITFMPPPPPSQPHATPMAYSAAPVPTPPLSSQPPAAHSQPQPSPRQQKPPTMPQPQKTPAPATPQLQQQQALVVHSSSMDIVMTPAEAPHDSSGYDGSGSGGGPASSRWPKAEVHALIQLRSNLDMRYQEAGPKGPLWEEISAGMRRMGYNRSSKRCKEKWENINKYFKKVKESNKKRPEDSKTCPYFHQLEALYRNKAALSSPSGAGGALALPPPAEHANNAAPQERIEAFTVAAPISQTAPQQHAPPPSVTKNDGNSNAGNGNGTGGGASEGVSGGMQRLASNGGSRFVFSEAGGDAAAAKKPEDIMKETTMEQPQPQVGQQATINSYNRTAAGGGADSDNMDEDDEEEDDYDDEDEDEDEEVDGNKMRYEIQFQGPPQHQNQHQQRHHNVVRPNAAAPGGGNPPGAAAPSAAAATTTAGSFLGMVQ